MAAHGAPGPFLTPLGAEGVSHEKHEKIAVVVCRFRIVNR